MKGEGSTEKGWTRMDFLRTVGANVATLSLLIGGLDTAEAQNAKPGQGFDKSKFTSLDLSPFFNCSSADLGPHPKARELGGESVRDGLIRTPGGEQCFRGIPFRLGPENLQDKRWLMLSTRSSQNSAPNVQIPLQYRATFLCVVAFCDWDKNEATPADIDVFELVGERLAEIVLLYEGGIEKTIPVRRRFEVSAPSVSWGHFCYSSVACREAGPRGLTDPLANAADWGRLQMGVGQNSTIGPWISALENPDAERQLTGVRLQATSEAPLIVCGLTLFHGKTSPLRHERLSLYRFTLPEATAEDQDRWKVTVDLGQIARTYVLNQFDATAWLDSPQAGLGERFERAQGGRYLYAEVVASRAATLTLHDIKNGKRYEFELDGVVPGHEKEARSRGALVEVLETDKAWLHGSDRCCHRASYARPAGLSVPGWPVHSALWSSYADQRCLVSRLWRRSDVGGCALRLRGWNVPGRTARGRRVPGNDQRVRIPSGSKEA